MDNQYKLVKTTAPILMALIAATFVYWWYAAFVNKNVMRVLVHGVFQSPTQIHVSSVDREGNARHLDSFEVTSKAPLQAVTGGTKRLNAPVDKLRLEFSLANPELTERSRQVSVHHVRITRPYNIHLFFDTKNLLHEFTGTQSQKEPPIIVAGTNDANILTSNLTVTEPNPVKAILLSMAFFFGLWFIFKHADWQNIPAIADMSLGRDISSKHEFGTINGLRGIAALLVLLSHTAPGFFALGVGLTMLFVISGFLLSKPFILDTNRIYSWTNIETYITKRLKRILPMYYLYVFVIYVVSLQLDTALRHFMFVQASGHLWPMTQIFTFYLLLPLILLITSALHRISLLIPITILIAGAAYWLTHMGDWKPYYNGDYFHEFYFYAFLIGVAASYIHYGWLNQSPSILKFCQRWRWGLAIIGFTVAFFTVAWSAPLRPPAWILSYISQFYVKCILSAAIILLALNTKKTPFNWLVSNWFFRSLGIVGFSFYILHGLGMQIVQTTQKMFLGIPNPAERSWEFMLVTLVVTYLMSLITYSYVERPFFGFKRPAQGQAAP